MAGFAVTNIASWEGVEVVAQFFETRGGVGECCGVRGAKSQIVQICLSCWSLLGKGVCP